jgi:hypothetical protein
MDKTHRSKVIITASEVIFPKAAKPRNASRPKPSPAYLNKHK